MPRDFKNLKVWTLAYAFTLKAYQLVGMLPSHERANIADQLLRAATSLPLNVAEGAGSRSNRIFLNFLNYAYNSGKEVEVLLMLCHDLHYIDAAQYADLAGALEEFKAHLYRFMKAVSTEIAAGMDNYSIDPPKELYAQLADLKEQALAGSTVLRKESGVGRTPRQLGVAVMPENPLRRRGVSGGSVNQSI
jgi:four helix bundle protein